MSARITWNLRRPADLVLVLLLLIAILPGAAAAQETEPAGKIDRQVVDEIAANGRTSFIVLMAEQADVSGARALRTKQEKGRYVFETLRTTAERTQADLQSSLKAQGVDFRSLYIVNAVVIEGDAALATELADRADVARIVANPVVHQDEPAPDKVDAGQSTDAIEWGVTNVGAPTVWATGVTGQGVTIAGADTGIRWTHAALQNHYRGWNGATADHNYNWWDAIHQDIGTVNTNPCGYNSPVPCDDNFHGTHTVGTVVGYDGGTNQIGVAPGANFIGCRNMDNGDGQPSTYAECFQFFLAPWDLNQQNADPAQAPDVINNSWGCPTSEGCTSATWGVIQTAEQNLVAAGVFVVASAGNSGSACGTISAPLAIFPESFAVGSYNSSNVIAASSSRGPRYFTNIQGPDVSAPGVNVRSATNSSDTSYTTASGTSMASPHTVGVVALLWSAVPGLVGQIEATKQYLRETAIKDVSNATCGSGANTAPWNTWDNTYGWGRVNAPAVIAAAQCPADIDYNDTVNILDIQMLASQWNLQLGDADYNARRDLDFDNAITISDIQAAALAWNTTCPT